MRTKYTLIALILICAVRLSMAQELQRKAMFGVAVGPLTEAETGPGNAEGVLIQEVIPGFTFDELGIKKGGVLLAVNGVKTTDLSSFQKATSAVRGGDPVEVLVNDGGEIRKYNGKATTKPLEEHPMADVHYGVVSYPGNNLRSLLYTPKGVEKAPVVFYLQGYTCQSVEYQDFIPMKKIVNDWIASGFAVYMVEKPGMGDSDCETGCLDIDFHQELEAFSRAYEQLLANARIDRDNVFLFGHSLGGVVAPVLAQQTAPKGVMVFGTVGKNWYDYMKDVVTEQQMMFGATREQVTETSKQSFPFLEDLMLNDLTNTEMVNNERYAEYLAAENLTEELKRGYYLGRHYKFWRSLGDIDIPEAWKKVDTHVYVMHGEYDVQAVNAKYARAIVDLVNDHKGKASFLLVPDTDHVLLKFDSMQENITSLTDGTYGQRLRTHYNPEVARLSVDWMNTLIKD